MSSTARFVMSAPSLAGLPKLGLPEVAFAGRSNVGKSTLAGAVLGKKGLVRTSRTPGRTQLLNLFLLDERLAVIDLPGYGYAKLPHGSRERLDTMTQEYLRGRDGLLAVVVVADARRDPVSAYDAYVVDWLRTCGRTAIVAVTKSDLVPKNRRKQRLQSIAKQLGVEGDLVLACSGETGEGIDVLQRLLWRLVGGAAPGSPRP